MNVNEITMSHADYNQCLHQRILSLERKLLALMKQCDATEAEAAALSAQQSILVHEVEGVKNDVRRHEYEIDRCLDDIRICCN